MLSLRLNSLDRTVDSLRRARSGLQGDVGPTSATPARVRFDPTRPGATTGRVQAPVGIADAVLAPAEGPVRARAAIAGLEKIVTDGFVLVCGPAPWLDSAMRVRLEPDTVPAAVGEVRRLLAQAGAMSRPILERLGLSAGSCRSSTSPSYGSSTTSRRF